MENFIGGFDHSELLGGFIIQKNLFILNPQMVNCIKKFIRFPSNNCLFYLTDFCWQFSFRGHLSHVVRYGQ